MGKERDKIGEGVHRTSIPCEIYLSPWSSKKSVLAKDVNGIEHKAYIDNADIIAEEGVEIDSKGVQGRVFAEVVRTDGDTAFVILSNPMLFCCEIMAVPVSTLQTEFLMG